MSDGHSRCPRDGCKDVEPYAGAHTGPAGKDTPRTAYSADMRDGGCGAFWFETSAAAAHNDRNRGIDPKHLKEEARVGRTMFTGSDLYRDRYAEVFGHD